MSLNLANNGSMIVNGGNMENCDKAYKAGLPENSTDQVCPVCDGQGLLWTSKFSKLHPITVKTATLILGGKLWIPYLFQKGGVTIECPNCKGLGRISRDHKGHKF